MNTILQKTTVQHNIPIKDGVYILSFRRTFDFEAGQMLKITTNPNIPPRLYSIASGNKEPEIRILYDLVKDGVLTPELSKLSKGDTLYISQPMGTFICKDEPAWWIATGTGIAPFASMFYSGFGKQKTLIHGGRYHDSFYFEQDFMSLGTHYIRCCSSEQAPGLYPGRLTSFLDMQQQLPQHIKYYLCGSSEMVVEVRDLLIRKNIPFENVHAEIYF